jgi:hypothetical protein
MSAQLPVAAHLRPAPPPPPSRDWCPLYERLPAPADREAWRWYDIVDFVPLAAALALPVEGQA